MDDEKTLLIIAHGNRRLPAEQEPSHKLAESLARELDGWRVEARYLVREPKLRDGPDKGHTGSLAVFPNLYADGIFLHRRLPTHLSTWAQQRETLSLPPTFLLPGLAQVMADHVERALRQQGLAKRETAVLLVGHGAMSAQVYSEPAYGVAEQLRRKSGLDEVSVAFLERDPALNNWPDLCDKANVLVLPFLAGGGHHTHFDIPRAVAEGAKRSNKRCIVLEAIGLYPELTLLVREALQAAIANHKPPRRGEVLWEPLQQSCQETEVIQAAQ